MLSNYWNIWQSGFIGTGSDPDNWIATVGFQSFKLILHKLPFMFAKQYFAY